MLFGSVPFRNSPREPGATPKTGLLRAIDVASYQPADLTAYIQRYGIEHVMLRMYQRSIEGAALQAHSRAQATSVLANGCSASTPYSWLYRDANPVQQVDEPLGLARDCGIEPKLWVLDIEPYTDHSLPTVATITAALNACEARGVQGAIYSGAWVWPLLGNPSFPGVPCVWAVYDGVAALNVVPLGGMVLAGKQYSDKAPDGVSLDMDVFDAAFV